MKNMGSLGKSSYMTRLSWFLDYLIILLRFDKKDS